MKKQKTMNIIYLNKSAKEVHKAIFEPINVLAKILRKELKGAYEYFGIEEKSFEDLHQIPLRDEFPGYCVIESTEKRRVIAVFIKFDWYKWDKKYLAKENEDFLKLDMTDHENISNQFHKVAIKRLNDPKFIQGIKDWLQGTKEFNELPWKEWEK